MNRVDELISKFAQILKSSVNELGRDKFRRYFEFKPDFLGAGQTIIMTAMERPSGTIDFEFMFRIGQITSTDCLLDLLKMNLRGIYGLYYAAIEDSEDPPGYFLWLVYPYIVPETTSTQIAAEIFRGNLIALMMPTKWPQGVYIWSEKE